MPSGKAFLRMLFEQVRTGNPQACPEMKNISLGGTDPCPHRELSFAAYSDFQSKPYWTLAMDVGLFPTCFTGSRGNLHRLSLAKVRAWGCKCLASTQVRVEQRHLPVLPSSDQWQMGKSLMLHSRVLSAMHSLSCTVALNSCFSCALARLFEQRKLHLS